MSYVAWSVVFGEQPTAAKWNILGDNDASFHDGTGIDDDAIIQRHIADDQILPAQLTSEASWWEEIARTTLTVASDTITVSSIPARKYLKVLMSVIPTGGTISSTMRFNGDTGNNYSRRVSDNGGADATTTSQPNVFALTGTAADFKFTELHIINIAGQEKLVIGHGAGSGAAGAGTAPTRNESIGKWANTAAQISSLTVNNGGTGDFAIGSEIVVLGHN